MGHRHGARNSSSGSRPAEEVRRSFQQRTGAARALLGQAGSAPALPEPGLSSQAVQKESAARLPASPAGISRGPKAPLPALDLQPGRTQRLPPHSERSGAREVAGPRLSLQGLPWHVPYQPTAVRGLARFSTKLALGFRDLLRALLCLVRGKGKGQPSGTAGL